MYYTIISSDIISKGDFMKKTARMAAASLLVFTALLSPLTALASNQKEKHSNLSE